MIQRQTQLNITNSVLCFVLFCFCHSEEAYLGNTNVRRGLQQTQSLFRRKILPLFYWSGKKYPYFHSYIFLKILFYFEHFMWPSTLCLKFFQSKDIHGIICIYKWFGLLVNNQKLEKLGDGCFLEVWERYKWVDVQRQ